ncbi:acetylserotonin O-methyltransferase [Streptomyces sp. AN091965]|uniref:acetylserotonin O-methyltransferase n=1 Tax=Streptomyces sp. AN091965 TaxID=2927803 RepID=UPI001F606226|nr:acetylserotonin O-methyltransferase [Streptomyces sp. AN091965]MCI3928721.1 acetylserotonin O-methyltransferase [Streptomyces sp. AN091965]
MADTNDENPVASAEDRGRVVELILGSLAAQTLRAAVRLRVVEIIGAKERHAADVAAEAGTQPQATARLLRALAGLGILQERAPDSYAVTSAGALLDPTRPDSLAALVGMFAEPAMLRAWEHLDEGVRTGETTFASVFGTDFFPYLKEHPELSALFNTAMSQGTSLTAAQLPHAYDFGRFTTVADIGGGDGTLLSPVLREHPALSGILCDTEEGLAQAPPTLRRHGVEDRCSLVVGDFFRSVPEGADLYLLKSILHDWNDDQVVTILGHCRAVLPPGGRVLIVEHLLPTAVAPESTALYLADLNMLLNVGGRERTREEFAELCDRAGLALTSVTGLGEGNAFCLIEAAAAEG